MEKGKDESISDYFSRMHKIVNEMKNNCKKIGEKNVVKKIMWLLRDNNY